MITTLHLENFKGFYDHTITFGEFSVLVGRNNAGKSSAIEALRIVSIVARKFIGAKYTKRPDWIGGQGHGIVPSLDEVKIKPETLFYKYNDPPAILSASFSNGNRFDIYFGPKGMVYAEAKDSAGSVVNSRKMAKNFEFTPICVLPQISPLEDYERVLKKQYVINCVETHLSSRHFRNQICFLYEHFDAFRDLFQQTWGGVRVSEFVSPDADYEDDLALMLSEDGFVAEASNFGHGLQMWLQIVWFLSRTDSESVVIIDEPDVYMNVEQQSKMLDMLRGRFRQCIFSTHAVKIIERCDDSEVLRLHRMLPTSLQGIDQETHDRQIESAIVAHRQRTMRLLLDSSEVDTDSTVNADANSDVDVDDDPDVDDDDFEFAIRVKLYDDGAIRISGKDGEIILDLQSKPGKKVPAKTVAVYEQSVFVEMTYPGDIDVFVDNKKLHFKDLWELERAKFHLDLANMQIRY